MLHCRLIPAFSDVPADPKLYLETPLDEFPKGDSLSLRCMIPVYTADAGNVSFQLHHLNEAPHLEQESTSSPSSYTLFTIAHLSLSDGGSYTCTYRVQKSGRWFNSTHSNSVTVIVSDRSNRPTLSLRSSWSVFVQGEDVDLTCTSPIPHLESTFHLLKLGKGAPPTCLGMKTAHRTADFSIPNVNDTDGGAYTCTYELKKYGRVYKSVPSYQVTVTVIGVLPKPSISLRPNLPFLLEGESSAIRCTAPETYTEEACDLHKNNATAPLGSVNPGRGEHVCKFPIEKAEVTNGGNYTCRYRAQVHGRMVKSSVSEPIALTVRARPTKPTISIAYQQTSKEYIINCTASVLYAGSRMYLYGDVGGEWAQITHAQVSGGSATFLISNISALGEGNFTCLSEATAAGRLLRSSFSDPVTVPTGGSNSPLSGVGMGLGGAIIALTVTLLIAVYCRKRGYCKTTADSTDLQAHLLLSWHDTIEDRDCLDHETLL